MSITIDGIEVDNINIDEAEVDTVTIDGEEVYKSLESGPGPDNLIAGDMDAGYFGTLSADDFITGDQLANEVGMTQGDSQNSNVDWIKYVIDGKICFRPMKSIRRDLSWDHINSRGCVFGNTTITIYGLEYKVRLMRGALTNPSKYQDSDMGAKGSEWNRIMLPIHERAANRSWIYPNHVESNIPDWGIGFTDEDLLVHFNYGEGYENWCQETAGSTSGARVVRGGRGPSLSRFPASFVSNSRYGWAPILELIE